ncbi:hypothetical protein Agabi119p4_7127 [Agaricus bisporus var. burnettii]|uniref:FIST domain-containing protein n=1 Tax=Agaricus bisporus var. burnettii TaxID=192524 RepID=A0A8H7EYN1_AGABI|nr:hypothetical protein Agabi119p4_7127 [Agaricus bisporus var. burnettii]
MALHLSTYFSRSPIRLLSRINTLAKQYAGHDLTLLFALSSNIPDPEHLGKAVNELTRFDRTRTVGCLSGRLGGTTISEVKMDQDVVSLAVAFMDSGMVRPFRSTIPGRDEAQVGRWHAFRKKDEPEPVEVPLDDDTLVWGDERALNFYSPSHIQGVLYFSDLKPEGLLSSFTHLPNVNKLGLIASSTPFVTGRPVTLFQNHEIFSSGAVGLVFERKTCLAVDFLDVTKISPVMTVTKSEGNMVNSLDNKNPTQLLLSAIKQSGLKAHASDWLKEEEQFSLAALSSSGKVDRVYKITAGDPSRGSISLDSPYAPTLGTQVQFLHRPSSSLPNLALSQLHRSAFNFLTVSEEVYASSRPNSQEDFELVLENTFLASSENGFVLGRDEGEKNGGNVKCSLAGSLGSFI